MAAEKASCIILAMIVIGATPQDILHDPSLTPEEKAALLHMLPKKLPVPRLSSPYVMYGEVSDRQVELRCVNGGCVNLKVERPA